MIEYEKRFAALNDRQREAVEKIDGPLLVIAGPGTGKTELLSMRAATILQKTDTLPSNILCLTFTDSGATAMRERLSGIIGADAYKVAIHTFHSFGTEIINQNAEYFFRGALFEPADELAQYEILRSIFAELDYTNPLAGTNDDTYTHLADTMTVISELKRSGLTSDELRQIIDANDTVIESIASDIAAIFVNKISKSTVHLLAPLAEKIAAVAQPSLPPAITPYANVLALSIAHAVDEAITTDSTKPITAWKNTWCEKNEKNEVVLKDTKRHHKLRAISYIYYQYLSRMQEASLYDFDDMILNVIHATETHPDLKANLQEKYQFIMVDEFQDTNLAQLRLLFNLTSDIESPNVMAVGDDDQAIFSFQGADVGNIQRFRSQYHNPDIIVLTDNYRSSPAILESSRDVITSSSDRLENTIDDLVKTLTPHGPSTTSQLILSEYTTSSSEREGVVKAVKKLIDSGVKPQSIAVIARRHHELVGIVPQFVKAHIALNYERRDNVLDHDIIRLIEHLGMIIEALHRDSHDEADALIPEILAHPGFGYNPLDIYKLSLSAWRNHQLWLELMQTNPIFQPFAQWLIVRAAATHTESLEQQIDTLLGAVEQPQTTGYRSPLYDFFFSSEKLQLDPEVYLRALEALRTVRDHVREHYTHEKPSLQTFLEFLAMHRELGSNLTSLRRASDKAENHVNLMSAHKSKGLEFDHVFIVGAIDSMWGERVRGRSRLISYPVNLPLAAAGDSFDERVRLFFVAMTRAKQGLYISYSTHDDKGKATLPASFLANTSLKPVQRKSADSTDAMLAQTELDWRGYLTKPLPTSLPTLLAPLLENYKLSATHLNNFLDVTRGGPQHFLLSNLLRFPQAKSAQASYGTAIHATLQRAHDYLRSSGIKRPIEDILGDFERILRDQHLTETDFDTYYTKGIDSLHAFLSHNYDEFTPNQRTEIGFGSQGVVIGEARLTGALDLIDIDEVEKIIRVTDYKTGQPSRSWHGKTDYEKIKLHKYRQQLMFYQLLVENSRDYRTYRFDEGVVQFVEPSKMGDILQLDSHASYEELALFRQLIQGVWQRIITLDLPDISGYDQSIRGIQQFERDIIDNNV